MTHADDWIGFAERLRACEAQLTAKASLALDAGNMVVAGRLLDSAREYREAAEDEEKRGMLN